MIEHSTKDDDINRTCEILLILEPQDFSKTYNITEDNLHNNENLNVKEINRDQNTLNKIPTETLSQRDKFIVINSQSEGNNKKKTILLPIYEYLKTL
jgi:hypothetical protein